MNLKLTTALTVDNPVEGDLEIQNGEFVQLSEIEQAAQSISTRLQFFKGESFVDVRQGVPYFADILIKGASLPRIRSVIRQTVLNVPGIVDVPQLDVTLDRASRALRVDLQARYQDGTVINSNDFAPLVIRFSAEAT